MPVLSETMIWKEKERSRVRATQMDNLRGLLDIRGWIVECMDKGMVQGDRKGG